MASCNIFNNCQIYIPSTDLSSEPQPNGLLNVAHGYLTPVSPQRTSSFHPQQLNFPLMTTSSVNGTAIYPSV